MSELSKESALSVLPLPLASDEHMYKLAQVNAQDQMAIHDGIPVLRIYADIMSAPESLCDKLAKDLAISWYDYDAPVAKKRATIHDSFYVRRHLGTVGAVKKALEEVFSAFTLQEWFDYYDYDHTIGTNGYFRILVSEAEHTEEKINAALEILSRIKPVTAHREGIFAVTRDAIGDTAKVDLCRVTSSGSTVTIPEDVTVIQPNQYSGLAAETIICPEGCTTINYNAFADCPYLRTVVIYRATTYISPQAFSGSDSDLTIQTTPGSYAESYAQRMGYAVIY